ncbi:MAG TPA: hypothetical protein VH277_17775 [Gemmatimonadaceae bacterium]|nr:hypothetical protein [Gemmatimonadaceae bacterium]
MKASVCLFIAATAIACGAAHDAAPSASGHDSKPHTDSAEGSTPLSTPTTSGNSVRQPALQELGDTAHPVLIAGRTKHDSMAYASAVAFGRRMMAKWPTPAAPLAGSVFPAKRVVAFYGNPLSKRMGVLGEYPVDTMLAKLDAVVHEWQKADPSTPVQPALQLIAVVAQGAPGRDGMYRLRMDTALVEKVYSWAKQRNALLFLDVQVAHSTMQQELPRLIPFLSRPDVHLAMDAEFSMHYSHEGVVPGKRIGQFDAKDVNWVADQLRQLVIDKKLPPKILVVHRWTHDMISNAPKIAVDPHVQIVMDMDGWGPPWQKFESYRDYIDLEPVEYTGFKLFFHNDVKHKDALLTPLEVLRLRPRPLYIQYQ